VIGLRKVQRRGFSEMDKQERWVFRLPSNEEGDKFLKDMHKYLNKDSYKVSRKFTGPRPWGTNPASTLKANATSVRVYVDSKRANDNINPYEYIQRGREIERSQQALKNARIATTAESSLDNLRTRLAAVETELITMRILLFKQGARHRKGN